MSKSCDYRVTNLTQQVMSPDELNSEALTTKQRGHAQYKVWYKSLASHLISYYSEWEEYARTGDIESVVQEHNLSPSVCSSAKMC